MINAIIFSKDRACQLRLLLESIWLHSYKILDGIAIIYTASTEKFADGYSTLQKEKLIPGIAINWHRETELSKDVNHFIQEYNQGFITFFTDDSVFFRTIHEYKFAIESCLHPTSDVACFTLRMGINTTEQMYWQRGHNLDLKYTKIGKFIKWKHTDYPAYHGYGYPLSLDGHIFRSTDIAKIVGQIDGKYNGVNSLEGLLSIYKFELPPCMVAFEHSALITVPINRVQNHVQNAAGIFYGISAEELNQIYLDGEVIDYYSIDFSNIRGTHQELKYGFRRRK